MNYTEARDHITSGDLLLWAAKPSRFNRHDIETELVRIGTASSFTHAGVALSERGRVMVMDITRRGCAARPLSSDVPFFWIQCPRPLSEAAIAYAYSCFGEVTYPSNWRALINWLTRQPASDKIKQCTDFALAIYRADGYDVPSEATPQAAFDWAMSTWDTAALHYVTEG